MSPESMRLYLPKNVERALTPTGGFLRGFAFSLNPYVGCAFGDNGGCPFCYVRAMPVAQSIKRGWGSWVIAKINLPQLLARELKSLERADKLHKAAVFMSTATDPYQGIERRLAVTRGALAAFAERQPRRIMVQTRSPLVERDIDLLQQLGTRVIASITVETDDELVRRAFTPTSPSIARRLECARRLREAGIFTQIAISPMLPNNPAHFPSIVDKIADRVIIDTYFAGDGSGGRRSRWLGMAEMYERLGYPEWFQPGAEEKLISAMRSQLGEDRVLFSRDGFNAV
jgi:DNA repair photolyase